MRCFLFFFVVVVVVFPGNCFHFIKTIQMTSIGISALHNVRLDSYFAIYEIFTVIT